MYQVKLEEVSRNQNDWLHLTNNIISPIHSYYNEEADHLKSSENPLILFDNKAIMESLKSLREDINSNKIDDKKDELLVLTLEENKELRAENIELKSELCKYKNKEN